MNRPIYKLLQSSWITKGERLFQVREDRIWGWVLEIKMPDGLVILKNVYKTETYINMDESEKEILTKIYEYTGWTMPAEADMGPLLDATKI